VKDLGLRGLFKGSAATLLRDVPFRFVLSHNSFFFLLERYLSSIYDSAVYFSLYGNFKAMVQERKHGVAPNANEVFWCGIVAGKRLVYPTKIFYL
jgi:hypothetical protein